MCGEPGHIPLFKAVTHCPIENVKPARRRLTTSYALVYSFNCFTAWSCSAHGCISETSSLFLPREFISACMPRCLVRGATFHSPISWIIGNQHPSSLIWTPDFVLGTFFGGTDIASLAVFYASTTAMILSFSPWWSYCYIYRSFQDVGHWLCLCRSHWESKNRWRTSLGKTPTVLTLHPLSEITSSAFKRHRL